MSQAWDDNDAPPHTDADAPWDQLAPEDHPPNWPAPPPPPKKPPVQPAPTLTVVTNTATAALADGHRATDAGNSDRLADLAEGWHRHTHTDGTAVCWAPADVAARREAA